MIQFDSGGTIKNQHSFGGYFLAGVRVFSGGGRIWMFSGSYINQGFFLVAMDDDFTVLSNKIYSSPSPILIGFVDGAGHT